MEKRLSAAVMLVLILIVISVADPAFSQSPPVPEKFISVGSNVTLRGANLSQGVWLYNGAFIVTFFGSQKYISSSWRSRISFNETNNDLTIRALTLTDSGEYNLMDLDSTLISSTNLSVQVPLSNVSLQANQINLVEFNDTVTFKCVVSAGSSVSYQLLCETCTFSPMVNGTFTLHNVTRKKQGPFSCVASNGLGNMSSPSVHLNVSYGPDDPVMTVKPDNNVHMSGSGITLSCSADSSPSATVQWMFNGVNLNRSSSELQLENASVNMSGVYECTVHNSITLRYNNGSVMVQIMDPISSVVVKNTGGPAILNQSLTLQCQVTGPVKTIQWWKDDHLISSNNNQTLTFNAVQHSDNGKYVCKAFNNVSNMSSSFFQVTVHYGPEMVNVSEPNLKKTGDNVTLSCQAESYPPSSFTWSFNGGVVSNMSTFVLSTLTKELSGQYICMAFNNITNLNSSATINLSVIDPIVNVTIRTNGIPAIENERHELTCEVAGDVDEIHWMTEKGELEEDNTTVFHEDKKTVTFVPVDPDDAGTYHCTAENAFGNMTSRSYNLVVNYGPRMTTVQGPNVAKVGTSVILSCSADSNPESSFSWYFNGTMVANMAQFTTPPLTTEMSGQYTCKAFNSVTNKTSNASLILSVIEPITNVHVQPMDSAVEGQSYNLSCGASGPVDGVYWMKDSEPLQAGSRITFLMNNKTVSFMPAERSDTGNYQCVASNDVESMTSDPYNLTVNYGPDTPVIQGPKFGEVGSVAIFNCSASSTPPSQFSWWFNDSEEAVTSMFTAGPLTFNMSGNYTCVAHNYITGMNSSNSIAFTVIEAIESVTIQNNTTTPINEKNFTLTCDVIGPYDAIYWMKDGKYLNVSDSCMNQQTNRCTERNILHFTPVTLKDEGKYQCVATNRAAVHKSPEHTLLINYGPLSVTISEPNVGSQGTSVTLRCSADSRPECNFQWFFTNQTKPLKTGPEISLNVTQMGVYICKATNPVTEITMYQTKAFVVGGQTCLMYFATYGSLMSMSLLVFSAHVLFH